MSSFLERALPSVAKWCEKHEKALEDALSWILFTVVILSIVLVIIGIPVALIRHHNRSNTWNLYNSYHYHVGSSATCYVNGAWTGCKVKADGPRGYLGYWCTYTNSDHNVPMTKLFSVRDMKNF